MCTHSDFFIQLWMLFLLYFDMIALVLKAKTRIKFHTKQKKWDLRKENKKERKKKTEDVSLLSHCCEGKLKWKNHEITNAQTIHVKRKLRNLFPLQNLRSSESLIAATTVVEFPASTSSTLVSLVFWSESLATLEKFWAIERQISQVLKLHLLYPLLIHIYEYSE